MPRRSKDSTHKNSSRLQLEKLYRECGYCNTNRPTNQFDKHQKACKTKWEILQQRKTTKATCLLVGVESGRSFPGHYIQPNEPEFVQGSSTMLVDIVDDLSVLSPSITGLDDFMTERIGECYYVLRVTLGFKIQGNM